MTDLRRRFQNPIGLRALAHGSYNELCRPCVDCGLYTGSYCDGDSEDCFAADRVPSEQWADNQRTPLCTACDRRHDMCRFCRGIPWATPPAHRDRDRHQPAGHDHGPVPKAPPGAHEAAPNRGFDQPVFYVDHQGGQPSQGRMNAAWAGPSPSFAGGSSTPGTKAPPTPNQIAAYQAGRAGAPPRAKPKAEPSAAFRQAEAELIELLGAAHLDDPASDR
ncbi:unnamed protein product [Symbiodinium sp. CCMP2592]|nr:unnamed protein product [Symbiodinium sp. CCMP2592]